MDGNGTEVGKGVGKTLISEEYAKLNQGLHEQSKMYGFKGYKWKKLVMKHVRQHETVLDYGCGKAQLTLDNKIVRYDPGVPEYKELPPKCDFTVCTDVLEHIEPEYLDNVLEHISEVTGRAMFATIATALSAEKLPDGSNAHRIVQDGDWWLKKLSADWKVETLSRRDNELVVFALKK